MSFLLMCLPLGPPFSLCVDSCERVMMYEICVNIGLDSCVLLSSLPLPLPPVFRNAGCCMEKKPQTPQKLHAINIIILNEGSDCPN